jgi:cell division protein FtsW
MSASAIPLPAGASSPARPASLASGAAEPWARAAVACALALTALGVLMVYSASSVRAGVREGDAAYFLKRQLAWAGIGIGALVLCARSNLDGWRRHSRAAFAGTVLLLALVLPFGTTVNGATRWFRLGSFSFQPSELAKLTLLVFTASWLVEAKDRLADFRRGFLPVAAAVGATALLVVKEPDLGTGLFLGVLGTALFFVGGVPRLYLLLLGAAAAAVVSHEVVERLDVIRSRLQFLEPTGEKAYQVRQSLVALGSGGLLGRGLGAGAAKLFYLPENSSDFILPMVGEEFGFAGTLLVVLLYGAFVRAGARVALLAAGRDSFAFLVAFGVTLWVGLQAVINIAVTTACAPTKGIALPFVSLGGSGLVVLFAATGLLCAAARRVDAAAAEGPPAAPAPAGGGAP